MSTDYQHKLCSHCGWDMDLVQEEDHGVWYWICSNPYCDYIKEDDYEEEYDDQSPNYSDMENYSEAPYTSEIL